MGETSNKHEKILYINSASLIAHIDEVREMLDRRKPVVLMISETHVTEDINSCEIECVDYKCVRNNSHSRFTGGCIIYIRYDFDYDVIDCTILPNNIWILSIKIYPSNRRVNGCICSVVYHSPSASKADFLNYFEAWLEEKLDITEQHIICGDFNIDMMSNGLYSKRLQNIIEINGMRQFVQNATRITNLSSTMIDLVISNGETEVEILLDEKISDHCTLEIESQFIPANIKNIENDTTVVKMVGYSAQKFCEYLSSFDWQCIQEDDLNKKAETLSSRLKQCINKFLKRVKVQKTNENKWFDNEIGQARKLRDTSFRKAAMVMDRNSWQNYHMARNKYTSLLRLKKSQFIQGKLTLAQGNSKETWTILKKLLSGKSKKDVDMVEINGIKITNTEEIAEQMNISFIGSIVDINRSIPNVINNPSINIEECKPRNSFKFATIDLTTLEKILLEMKNKRDIDLVSPSILLDSLPVIGHYFMSIINESLISGIFPEAWKTTTVVPVPKVSRPVKCEDYRPINMLPTCEKVLEKVVKSQLYTFLESSKLLSNNQSGYRKNHSCETALNLLLAKWKETINDKNTILCVFLDLKRAFETIDRSIMINKLKKFGLKANEINWFISYLSTRKQCTKIGSCISSSKDNDLGVPQGSVLGAILFIMYMNDLPEIGLFTTISLFADDTLIYISGKDVQHLSSIMNADLTKISEWLNINKLKLNVNKTKCMQISNKALTNEYQIIINGCEIEKVSNIKYLGILLDNKLTFKENINYLCKKVAKKISFLARLAKNLTLIAKINVYKTVIAPHFEYCASILFLSNEELFLKMQKLQNKAMRIILKCNKYTSVEWMLHTLQWMNVRQRIYTKTLNLIFQIKNKKLPEYLCNLVISNADVHNYPVRNRNDFRLPYCRTNRTQNSLMYKGLKMFNDMPDIIKMETNENFFKRKMKCYVKENL